MSNVELCLAKLELPVPITKPSPSSVVKPSDISATAEKRLTPEVHTQTPKENVITSTADETSQPPIALRGARTSLLSPRTSYPGRKEYRDKTGCMMYDNLDSDDHWYGVLYTSTNVSE